MTTWQPIDTAPRDGTWFDVWAVMRGSSQRFTNVEIGDDGRYFVNENDAGYLGDCWTVTHWMPLPEPPKEDK